MPSLRPALLLAVALATGSQPGAAQTPGSGRAVASLEALPPQTTLPIQLHQTLHAGRTGVGTAIRGSTTQRIPLAPGYYVPAGVEVSGTVTASTPQALTLRFDTLTVAHRSTPITTTAVAIATFVAVEQTRVPANGSTDRGNADPASWTTEQLGGDQVVRSGWIGPVIDRTTQTVGSADYWGVYTLPEPHTAPHAVGPFSHNSSGLFGFAADCSLSGTNSTLTCRSSKVSLRAGDVLLLRVN